MNSSPYVIPVIPGRQPLGTEDLETQKLINYAFKIVRRYFRADDEYFSEANLAVLEAKRGFKPGAHTSLETYLYWKVWSRCKSLDRTNAKRSRRLVELTNDHNKIEDPRQDPVQQLILKETLSNLSDPELGELLLHGHTQEEIGRIREMPRTTVEYHLTKLRKELAVAC